MTEREHTCPHCNFAFNGSDDEAQDDFLCPDCGQQMQDTSVGIAQMSPATRSESMEDAGVGHIAYEDSETESQNKSDSFENRMFGKNEKDGDFSKSIKDTLAEFKNFDFGLLKPMLMVFVPRLLKQKAVKWVVGFGLFPLFVLYFSQLFKLSFEKTAWFLGGYFCVFWIVFFNSTLAPSKEVKKQGVKWAFFTMLIGLPILFAWQNMPIIRDIYSGTQSQTFLLRMLAFILGVGVCEELCKALPLLLFGRNKPSLLTPRNAMYLGIMSGLGFALAEVVQYTYSYWQSSAAVSAQAVSAALGKSLTWRGWIDLDQLSGNLNEIIPKLVEYYGNTVTTQIVRFMSLPLLHAAWAGVVGYFIGLSLLKKRAQWVFIIIGIGAMAVMHGLYNVFSGGLLGFAFATVSILMLMSYLSEEKSMTQTVKDAYGPENENA